MRRGGEVAHEHRPDRAEHVDREARHHEHRGVDARHAESVPWPLGVEHAAGAPTLPSTQAACPCVSCLSGSRCSSAPALESGATNLG